MPLHDWRDDWGWDSVRLVWLAQLLEWVQPRLRPLGTSRWPSQRTKFTSGLFYRLVSRESNSRHDAALQYISYTCSPP
jgi:hypothetical protein